MKMTTNICTAWSPLNFNCFLLITQKIQQYFPSMRINLNQLNITFTCMLNAHLNQMRWAHSHTHTLHIHTLQLTTTTTKNVAGLLRCLWGEWPKTNGRFTAKSKQNKHVVPYRRVLGSICGEYQCSPVKLKMGGFANWSSPTPPRALRGRRKSVGWLEGSLRCLQNLKGFRIENNVLRGLF